MPAISAIFARLEGYCREAGYKGWDPYDGLNSRVFKILPVIKDLDVARLAWIQLFKRNPVNLRKLFLVPKGYNPKGVALMLSGYCNLFEYVRQSGERIYGNPDELPDRIRSLADLLVSLRSPSVNNSSAWGYNFDWQARRLFFFPQEHPQWLLHPFVLQPYSVHTRLQKMRNIFLWHYHLLILYLMIFTGHRKKRASSSPTRH